MRYVATAETLASKQRDISIAEFFEKNRHLLGFDNPRKALLTTVKEAVDNSLDACEEADILPELEVEVRDMGNDRFRIIVEDNGPGIVKAQIPKIFAKLLYGSKFHSMKQSLTADEPILIQEDGSCKLVPIGEFVDRFCQGESDKDISKYDIKVPCFDPKTQKYAFRQVSHAIKHERRNEIYNVRTQYGKQVKVTGAHSLFTLDKDTFNVREIEARQLSPGDHIIVPKRLPEPERKLQVNLLDYLRAADVRRNNLFLYTDKRIVRKLFENARVIHKKKQGGKSRKYFRFDFHSKTDILDDSYKQYISKGFVPLWLALRARQAGLLPEDVSESSVIRSYRHGEKYDTPIIWPITHSLMKLLGLFVAEGHTDKRQVGFTFGKHEKDLIKIVTDFAVDHGWNATLEERPKKNSIRVKLFGGLLSKLLRRWTGRRAENKHIPDFVYHAAPDLRQTFLDYLYAGDGHNTKERNQLMHSTVSEQLANEIQYLWLLQGVQASTCRIMKGGYGQPRESFVTTVYGSGIEASKKYSGHLASIRRSFEMHSTTDWFRELGLGALADDVRQYIDLFASLDANKEFSYDDAGALMQHDKPGYKLRHLQESGWIVESDGMYLLTEQGQKIAGQVELMQQFTRSDLTLLRIEGVDRIDEGYDWVYDLSVPQGENFVGGFGGIACHNSRGQQGIGISASVMYGQLTTGRPAKITSKTAKNEIAHYYELKIDTRKNKPSIELEDTKEWKDKEHGTRIEIDLEGTYMKGAQSIDTYLKQTAIVNPHLQLIYVNPRNEQYMFPRASEKKPVEAKEIQPHPYGIELGMLMKMLQATKEKTVSAFLRNEFSRVSAAVAKEILEKAKIRSRAKPKSISRPDAEKIMKAIKDTKIMSPPTDCISPIGEELLEKGLKKEINAEFYTSVSRRPAVYRGNPFVIECAIAYGGNIKVDGSVNIMRFANKVPLLYQAGGCAITKAMQETNWKSYGLDQSGNSTPRGPAVIVVHMASVWVPFTSEAKEALAHYDDIIKEVKLCIQEAGRNLKKYTKKKRRVKAELKKRSFIEMYIPHLAAGVTEILGLDDADEEQLEDDLVTLLEKKRGKIASMEFDESKNVDYDEAFAKIGKEDDSNDSEEDSEE